MLRGALVRCQLNLLFNALIKQANFKAFGGIARRDGIDYNGWTTGNKTVKADMARFRKYRTSG